MISTIIINKLRISEFMQFLKDVVHVCISSGPDKLKITSKLDPVADSAKKLDHAYKTEQGSELTEDVRELDDRRDMGLTSLGYFIKGYQNYFDKAIQAAGNTLARCYERYGGGNISRLNYRDQTNTVTNLIAELETKQELVDAIKKVQQGPLIDEIKQSNILFDQKYLERIDEEAENESISTTEIKKQATGQYYDLVELIEAHITIGTGNHAEYQSLVKKLNVVIEKYNGIISARSNKADGDQDPADGEAIQE